MSKIVTGYIKPIQFKDLKWNRLFPDMHKVDGVQVRVQANPNHPVTKELMENLPRCTDDGLRTMRAYIANRDPNCGSLSEEADVQSWLQMIDAEIHYRLHERKSLFDVLRQYVKPGKGV